MRRCASIAAMLARPPVLSLQPLDRDFFYHPTAARLDAPMVFFYRFEIVIGHIVKLHRFGLHEEILRFFVQTALVARNSSLLVSTIFETASGRRLGK